MSVNAVRAPKVSPEAHDWAALMCAIMSTLHRTNWHFDHYRSGLGSSDLGITFTQTFADGSFRWVST